MIVAGPGQVLDRSRDWLELILKDVFLVDGVPDPDLAALVGAGDVEPAGAVLGDVDLAAVLGVDVGHLGAAPIGDEHCGHVTRCRDLIDHLARLRMMTLLPWQ